MGTIYTKKPKRTKTEKSLKARAAYRVLEAFLNHSLRKMAAGAWQDCERKLAVFRTKLTSSSFSRYSFCQEFRGVNPQSQPRDQISLQTS